MRKILGIILIAVGIVCLPQIFTPEPFSTIGGIIGVSVFSFLPAYFLLRKKSNNKKENNKDNFQNVYNIKESDKLVIDDKDYSSLLEELKEKCNPQKFMQPYDFRKIEMANEIYPLILACKESDEERLKDLRERASIQLGIIFSTSKIYKQLEYCCNPKRFMNPYNPDKVKIANQLYLKINNSVNDIFALEEIKREAIDNGLWEDITVSSLNYDGRNNIIVGFIGCLMIIILIIVYCLSLKTS